MSYKIALNLTLGILSEIISDELVGTNCKPLVVILACLIVILGLSRFFRRPSETRDTRVATKVELKDVGEAKFEFTKDQE